MHKKMEDLTSLKNELIEDFKKKKDEVSVAEAGEMVDMIKDISSIERTP